MRCLGNANEGRWPEGAEFWFCNTHMTCVWRRAKQREEDEKVEKQLEEDIGLSSPISTVLSWKQTSSVLLQICKVNAINYLVAIYWIFFPVPIQLTTICAVCKVFIFIISVNFCHAAGTVLVHVLKNHVMPLLSCWKAYFFLNMMSSWFNLNNWALQLDQPKLISQLFYPLVLLQWSTEFKLS